MKIGIIGAMAVEVGKLIAAMALSLVTEEIAFSGFPIMIMPRNMVEPSRSRFRI